MLGRSAAQGEWVDRRDPGPQSLRDCYVRGYPYSDAPRLGRGGRTGMPRGGRTRIPREELRPVFRGRDAVGYDGKGDARVCRGVDGRVFRMPLNRSVYRDRSHLAAFSILTMYPSTAIFCSFPSIIIRVRLLHEVIFAAFIRLPISRLYSFTEGSEKS